MQQRKFHVITDKSPAGVVFIYNAATEQFCGIEIRQEDIKDDVLVKILNNIRIRLQDFMTWVKCIKADCVELIDEITFEKFWMMYDDRARSSKKRSQKLWDKLDKDNQVRAYYFYSKYNRSRGTAEKKYCETYLAAEQWNN